VNVPYTSLNGANIFDDDATAISAVTGIYTQLSSGKGITTNGGNGGTSSISVLCGLSADEFTLFSGVTDASEIAYYKNSLFTNISQSFGTSFWSSLYNYIYECNDAIDGLNNSQKLTSNVKQQLLGEVKFLRAFFYFYLVNLYGDVPLILTTDYSINSRIPRSAKSEVYRQIIADLQDAKGALNTNYVDGTIIKPTQERVRPNVWVATALLARTYLYYGDFINAETEASSIIGNTTTFGLSTLDSVFLKNSKDAIWQLQPVNSGWNTEDARLFIIPSTGPSNTYPVFLSDNLINSFEPNDLRKSKWVKSVKVGSFTYNYPFKYKINTINTAVNEYLMVFRLGEMYLIRAEARAQQNKIAEAITDLNMIRARAGLTGTTAFDKNSLLTALLHERQVELFSEWGHRWLDLKRTGNIDVVMSLITPQKGGVWKTDYQLYPIPFSDLQMNQNLIQNAGY
jgi:hypothetical protein